MRQSNSSRFTLGDCELADHEFLDRFGAGSNAVRKSLVPLFMSPLHPRIYLVTMVILVVHRV